MATWSRSRRELAAEGVDELSDLDLDFREDLVVERDPDDEPTEEIDPKAGGTRPAVGSGRCR